MTLLFTLTVVEVPGFALLALYTGEWQFLIGAYLAWRLVRKG